jgi:hypothetical protein
MFNGTHNVQWRAQCSTARAMFNGAHNVQRRARLLAEMEQQI